MPDQLHADRPGSAETRPACADEPSGIHTKLPSLFFTELCFPSHLPGRSTPAALAMCVWRATQRKKHEPGPAHRAGSGLQHDTTNNVD